MSKKQQMQLLRLVGPYVHDTLASLKEYRHQKVPKPMDDELLFDAIWIIEHLSELYKNEMKKKAKKSAYKDYKVERTERETKTKS